MSPRREKLTSPQTRIALARGNRPAQHLLPIPGPVDTEAARRLFHRQRRTAVRTVGLLSLLLFGMSGAFALWPQLTQSRVAGVPLSWALVVAAVYPLLFLLALWHVRSAEQAEARSARAAAQQASRQPAPHPPEHTAAEHETSKPETTEPTTTKHPAAPHPPPSPRSPEHTATEHPPPGGKDPDGKAPDGKAPDRKAPDEP